MKNINDFVGKIHCADCFDIIKQLPDKCIDLICVDPPYFKIAKCEWDSQFRSMQEFQLWVYEVGKEFKRILKDNGSFYWFGDDRNIAYCQIELDKHFRILNNLVWEKPAFVTRKSVENRARSYMPITERCLFYEKKGDKTGLEMAKKVIENPLAKYLKEELLRYFGTVSKIREFVVKVMKMDGAMVNRWFEGSCLISLEKWNFVKEKLGEGYLDKDYEDLKKDYEDLKQRNKSLINLYETKRRIWNNDEKAVDVLCYPVCNDKFRFHETQKPIELISYIISRSSKENDLVLDCFSGSGTVAIACHNLNRKFICVEKDSKYVDFS